MALSPSEQLLYNAVRITAYANGSPIQHGTGFYWRTNADGGYTETLITNKHVLAGATHLHIQMHLATNGPQPSGEFDLAILELRDSGIINHPDIDVDLCAVTISGIYAYSEQTGRKLFYVPLDASHLPTTEEWGELDAFEEVLMIGCPNGLFDEVNALPILRRGTTASHPAFLYNGKHQFVIDAACFPGSSGSPVLLYSSPSYYDKKKGAVTIGMRVKLLGILFAGPTINQQGKIILATTPKVETAAMMHLGYVIRSSRLLELDEIIRGRAVRLG